MGLNTDRATTPIGPMAFRYAGEGADRMAAIQHALSSRIWDFEFEPAPGRPFFGEGRIQSLPELALADVTTSEGRTKRAAHHRVDDQFLFNVCLSGSTTVSQCGREIVIDEGDAVLSMGAEIAAMQFTASRFLSFRIPAKAIAALVPDVADRAARRIARDTEALKLLTVYAGGLQNACSLATPALRQLAGTHVHDLIALALGTTHDATGLTQARGMRAARLQAIKADIENEPAQDVSLAVLAARHRLPLRYVRRLFEEEGTTFTEFVLSRRLARAHRMLIRPRAAALKISIIAAEAGFNNLSYFNEVFRRRYGTTPSDVRAQALAN